MDKVVHFEIPAEDTERAKKFYAGVFGWEMENWGEEYTIARTVAVDEKQMAKKPGAINGGIFKRPADAPNLVIYIAVASIEDAIGKVEAAGGKVVTPKTPIAEMGFYARIADTEDNIVGLFQGKA